MNRETIAARHRRMLAWRGRCRRFFAAVGGVVNRASRLCDRYWLAFFAGARAVSSEEDRKIMDAVEREDLIRSVDIADTDDGWTPHEN